MEKIIGIMGELRVLGRMLRRMLPGRRHYLLMDGLNSCAYIPRHTYGYLNRLMLKELERNPEAENSLRFVWARMGDSYVLAVNPTEVEMTQTHGLTRDSGGRVIIPCPYVQQIYQAYGLEPERCGRMWIRELNTHPNPPKGRELNMLKREKADVRKPWLAIFELRSPMSRIGRIR